MKGYNQALSTGVVDAFSQAALHNASTEYHKLLNVNEDGCTLVTCTPYGINTHRLLVHGVRIPYEEAEVIIEETVQKEVVSTWQRQYVRGLIVGVVCALEVGLEFLFAWLIWRRRNG